MNIPVLTKEQRTLLNFFSRMAKTQRTIALRIVEAMAKKSGHAAPVDSDNDS